MRDLRIGGVLVGIFVPLVSLMTLCVGCNRASGDGPLPEYYGLFYQSDQGLREITAGGNPAYVAASKELYKAFSTKDKSEIEKGLRTLAGSCERAGAKPALIVYHQALTPQMLHLEQLTKTGMSEVELAISPIEKRQSMYKVRPKQDVPAGIYYLSMKEQVFLPSKRLDCFLVNMTVDEMVKSLPTVK